MVHNTIKIGKINNKKAVTQSEYIIFVQMLYKNHCLSNTVFSLINGHGRLFFD
jgi:hypothetical protein